VIGEQAGAAGTLGASAMVNAKPDGYTITQVPITVFRYPHMRRSATTRSPISRTSSASPATRSAWCVRSDAPWKTGAIHRVRQGESGQGFVRHAGREHVAARDDGDIAQRDGIKWVQSRTKATRTT
jgi:hypothetical protein